jgi:UDP-N-acetylglucosamine--N-acetylmuramyl-(pentapeptide) pyrophosphoryl-undecaprenol N-acetylglucosamine transferase
MKILLTGGGSGGHFYPVIAVAHALRELAKEAKLVDVELYYMAPQPYDRELLFENKITFVPESAGKMRRYFSFLNIIDFIKTVWGAFHALWTMFWLYPDVVFAKGGYVSFPALFAARFFRIPVVIHESDSVPGRLNRWAGRFARRIAISFPEASDYFPKARVALTGNPIRQDLLYPIREGAHDQLHLEQDVPVIVVLGGSQGSQLINENLMNALPALLERFQIIHQTGKNNYDLIRETANVVLEKHAHKDRYKPFDNLAGLELRMAAGVADIVISRAGSTIFEIAAWGIPAILIPISDSNGDHQRKNAYNYARTGAAMVVEEINLTPHILTSEVTRIFDNQELRTKMHNAAKQFARTDAAMLIAQELITIALEHER